MSSLKPTPMIQQYLAIKEKYADSLLFYRMGDFYEMFFEDAQTAAQALDITLTSRNKKDKAPVPMCGVPVKAVRGYISRLIEQGYKVAICEQVEDPAIAKGIVKREVVRVVTPGMVIEDEILEKKRDNYVLSLAIDHHRFGISYLDISTGKFRLTESDTIAVVVDELQRISPREIILPESLSADSAVDPVKRAIGKKRLTFLENRAFDFTRCQNRLTDQFNTANLEGFGCERMKAGIRAAGALLFYVRETQKQKLGHVTDIKTVSLDAFLIVDETTSRNLEIFSNLRDGSQYGTLIGVMDKTATAIGGRLFREWMRYPLIDLEEIRRRQDAVAEAVVNIHATGAIRDQLKSVYDLERLGSKIVMGHANARDLIALRTSLEQLPDIIRKLQSFCASMFHFEKPLDDLAAVAARIHHAIREDAPPVTNEGGLIQEGYNVELDSLVAISRDGKGWLLELEKAEKENTGISTLKVRFNKVFGYYIEVPKSKSGAVPQHYVRKQTLVNAERYITDELKKFETMVLSAEEDRAALEYRLFTDILVEIGSHNPSIQRIAFFLSAVDCLLSMAVVAEQNDYRRPNISDNGALVIEDGRHPVIEKMLTGERFVPNSISLDNERDQILVITGPNMAGKSTILRQVAIIVIMTHMGSFVPAKSADVSLTDRIFSRVGALDNIAAGQSTFMIEMQETANILHHATENSLIILDEIGRGTSTFDGLSIAWAVAEYLHDHNNTGVKTMFATHYHELTELANTRHRVSNYNIAVKEWNDEIIFLRKLVAGGTNRSYGIQVARLAGIPSGVIGRAKEILANIENGEHNINGMPAIAGSNQAGRPGHVQMTLFQKPEFGLIESLVSLDLTTLTPLEAMNHLDRLQEKAKEVIQ